MKMTLEHNYFRAIEYRLRSVYMATRSLLVRKGYARVWEGLYVCD